MYGARALESGCGGGDCHCHALRARAEPVSRLTEAVGSGLSVSLSVARSGGRSSLDPSGGAAAANGRAEAAAAGAAEEEFSSFSSYINRG